MAKVRRNNVVEGMSGKLGQVMLRLTHDGETIASALPSADDDRELSNGEKARREQFRLATVYGKGAQNKPEYVAEAKKRHTSAYQVAVADYLRPPEILDLDVAPYTGIPNQIIRVRAADDVKIVGVLVMILTDADVLIEKGQAVQDSDDKTLWIYTTTATAGVTTVKILADVSDLTGHVTEKVVKK